MQLWVCRGRGYVPSEKQVKENYPADSLMLDALFSPVIKVHYDVENSRVGQVTDYTAPSFPTCRSPSSEALPPRMLNRTAALRKKREMRQGAKAHCR